MCVIYEIDSWVFRSMVPSRSVSLLSVASRAVVTLSFVIWNGLMIRLHVLALAMITKNLRLCRLTELVRKLWLV